MVSTRETKKDATEAIRSTGSPADTRCSRPRQVRVHHGPVALGEKISVTLTLMPAAIAAVMAGRPATVAGILIIRLGRSTRCQSRLACGQRARGVVRQVRADLQADVAVAPAALLVQRPEQIRRRLDILDRKLPEDLLRALAGLRQRYQPGIIVLRLGDRVHEDRRIGGNAADLSAGDHPGQLAIVQQAALDVVVPDRLAGGM